MEKKEFNKEIYIYICLFTMRVSFIYPYCILYLEIRRFYLQYTVLDAVRIIRYINFVTQSYSVSPPRFVISYKRKISSFGEVITL